MKIKLNKENLRNKILGCWIGKNIGGTMGAPYEGMHNMNDIEGYTTAPGTPLPNDDLDLQLAWLYLVEKYGANNITTKLLADYWVDVVTPHWNEYGVGKSNLEMGLLPPLSGEYKNEKWKHSNGAWIRSEVWAGLAPGFSDIAIKYAVMDAMVDHGLGEGTYAEIFTASLESAAYYESDIHKLIDIALSKIPQECRVHKAVSLVKGEYRKGTPYREVREMLVEQSKDIGWFQAPANVGFVVIGLLYGEGDFKKSMIYAINCGDDTDCTGATVGAVLGIIGGKDSIPADWQEYIGDSILTIAVNGQFVTYFPKSCTELTERVLNQIPFMLYFNGIEMEYTDGETEIAEEVFNNFNKLNSEDFLSRTPYSFDIAEDSMKFVRVEYDKLPEIKLGEEFKIRLRIYNKTVQIHHSQLKLITPEGFEVLPYEKSVHLEPNLWQEEDGVVWEATVIPGQNIDAINRLYVEITTMGQCNALIVPITLLG